MSNAKRLEVAIEQGCERLFALQADHSVHFAAAFDHDQRRDAGDAKLLGEIALDVHVDLIDSGFAFEISGEFFDGRRQGLARTAPLGPKVK